ncbi:hypothetical protein ACFFTN_13740 [Aminobacter aganoensis]|uniref:Uncharacterized protein n=1 Tax=Aminobacter aganoensis TaxID=83264 RepID=A0A7X0KNP7_9HYPH|nr:hypothetical protein [Aminobacter aganoensis]MBB6357344.1 hypothetical protein [Aminobacter aganoensis]
MLDEAQRRGTSLRHLAYILSTAYQETAHTMQPIRERGGEGQTTAAFKISTARKSPMPDGRPSIILCFGNTSKVNLGIVNKFLDRMLCSAGG